MDPEWNDGQPIYRQLHDRVVAMILDGLLKEGDPLPSVRGPAADVPAPTPEILSTPGVKVVRRSVVRVFGEARAHHAYLFINKRANRMKVLVHDGFGLWLCAATASSIDCCRTSRADRTVEWRDASQCPKDRKPIFFIPSQTYRCCVI